jgi:dienelactone hydrolase
MISSRIFYQRLAREGFVTLMPYLYHGKTANTIDKACPALPLILADGCLRQ